ncbi:MAG: Maf family protein [Candidatus Hodarchaeota archaeon]
MIDYFILGSKSPDRKELMEKAGLVPCLVMPSDYNESDEAGEPSRLAEIYAKKKGESVLRILRAEIKKEGFLESFEIPGEKRSLILALITADTIVSFKSEIFGKASNDFEAFSTISRLQGQTHKLITGYHLKHLLLDKDRMVVDEIGNTTDHTVTRVKFLPMDTLRIKEYIETGEWKGRAGCYQIQKKASQFIKSVEGSHSGVIGLPISSIVEDLEGKLGLKVKF